jgi:hypothetical protein
MRKKSVFIALGVIVCLGSATALTVAFTNTNNNGQSVPSLGSPIALASTAMPDTARNSIASYASYAGIDVASLQRLGTPSGPGVVFGKDQGGAVEWAVQTPNMVSSFRKAADALSTTPVSLGVATFKTADGGLESYVIGLYDTTKVAVVRVTMSDGQVVDAAASSIPNTSYASFVLTTAESVNPTLVEAFDGSGNVVYRHQVDVLPECYATGSHC